MSDKHTIILEEFLHNNLVTQPVIDEQEMSRLEFELTSAAIGYEYATQALALLPSDFGADVDRIKDQIDEFRQKYFDARMTLLDRDSETLRRIEQDLQQQRLICFEGKSDLLH